MRRLALVLLLVAACSKAPNRWEEAEQKAQAAEHVDTSPKVEGSKLNAYFPSAGPNGAKRVFTAEKRGYVEAKLVSSDGAELAMLAVSEAATDALAKFASAPEQVDGYPLVTVGSNQSSVLVNNKFQVKVSSKVLAASERKALLAQFDLKGLASQ